MKHQRHGDDPRVWLGWVGPTAFFAAHIGGYAATPLACHARRWLEPSLFAVAALVCLAAACATWLARGAHATPAATDQRARFLALVSTTSLLLFALVLLWDVAASLTYSGCER
jgi:hypothetical protein